MVDRTACHNDCALIGCFQCDYQFSVAQHGEVSFSGSRIRCDQVAHLLLDLCAMPRRRRLSEISLAEDLQLLRPASTVIRRSAWRSARWV